MAKSKKATKGAYTERKLNSRRIRKCLGQKTAQDPFALPGKPVRQVDGGGRLAHAAVLVGDCDGDHRVFSKVWDWGRMKRCSLDCWIEGGIWFFLLFTESCETNPARWI